MPIIIPAKYTAGPTFNDARGQMRVVRLKQTNQMLAQYALITWGDAYSREAALSHHDHVQFVSFPTSPYLERVIALSWTK